MRLNGERLVDADHFEEKGQRAARVQRLAGSLEVGAHSLANERTSVRLQGVAERLAHRRHRLSGRGCSNPRRTVDLRAHQQLGIGVRLDDCKVGIVCRLELGSS